MLARLFALALLLIILSGILTAIRSLAGDNVVTAAATPLGFLGLAALFMSFLLTVVRG